MVSTTYEIGAEMWLDIYKRAALLRHNDDLSVRAIKAGRLKMPYYSPRGQEIIPSAVSANLTDKDYICTIYRGTHDMLAKGMPPKLLWAEIAGRTTGTCKGKGGPMHLTYPPKGIMVTTGIVGSSMPIANGLAWASVLEGDDIVTVSYFGDGASNIGAFHEALNLASVWKLPVIFVCQNNLFGEHTAYSKATATASIANRGVAYDMPSIRVSGNEPGEVYIAAREAVQRARRGAGPTLIEAVTFRFQGHVFGDADEYMDKEMKAEAIRNDPVPRFRQWLIEEKISSEEALAKIEHDIEEQLEDAISFALESPFPDLDELSTDVFAEGVLV